MATAVQKITLASARDIPFNKLVLSQSNVRRVKAGVSIEEMAESIVRRGLIQSLHVRAVLDAEGAETGMFEVPAGGRRYRALELLVKQKRLNKTAPVPCVVSDAASDVLIDEISLAENIESAPLHPLDQYRAFQAMRDKGMTEEAIAAAFFVGVNVVKQRLRLASVAPSLLDVYAEDGMTLEQLMAFTVSEEDDDVLWDQLATLDDASRMALLAHCVSFGVNALYEKPNPYSGHGVSEHGLRVRLAQADRLAQATGLDMVEAGWRPTVGNYLGRVTKARILEAVREGAGERAAQLIDHLKKGDMAKEAERLLADSGWLPEPLRLAAVDDAAVAEAVEPEADALPAFLANGGGDPAANDADAFADLPERSVDRAGATAGRRRGRLCWPRGRHRLSLGAACPRRGALDAAVDRHAGRLVQPGVRPRPCDPSGRLRQHQPDRPPDRRPSTRHRANPDNPPRLPGPRARHAGSCPRTLWRLTIMAKLKLGPIADDKPVKVTLELSASLHRDLVAYAGVLARESGQAAADPMRLIAPMLERFMATDRGFAKARRNTAPV